MPVSDEIRDLSGYLNGIPHALRASRAFAAYESRLQSLRSELAQKERELRTKSETGRPQPTEVVVDESAAFAAYANFARVTATPEEVIVDFALNPQPFADRM